MPSGWVVTGSAYPLAPRSEWAGGEEAQRHSPDTLVLAIQEKTCSNPIRAPDPLIVARGKYVTYIYIHIFPVHNVH